MVSPFDRSKYLGPNQFVPYLYAFPSVPTTTNIYQSNGSLYPVGDQGMALGINTATGQLFYLQNYVFSGGTTTANWIPLTSSGGTGPIFTVQPEKGSAVNADSFGVLNFKSVNKSILQDAPPTAGETFFTQDAIVADADTANTLNVVYNLGTRLSQASTTAQKIAQAGPVTVNSAQFQVGNDGGGNSDGFISLVGSTSLPAVQSETVDAFTAPAVTATVSANGSGDVRVKGAAVAAGTNPVRTNTHAANEYTVEVQTAQAIAATDATKIGLSNYDSSQFSVDGNGFVKILSSILGTSYPGLPANLAFSKAANTTTFTGSDGTALSSTNKATFWINHPSTRSNLVQISLVNPWQVIDAGGANDMAGNSFGTSAGAWSTDMPWYIYLVVNDTADGGAIALSRVPNRTTAPVAGKCATRGSAVASTQGSFYFLDEVIAGVPTAPTVANFDTNPCVCVGGLRVQKAAANDWVIQTPDNSDGIGLFHDNVGFTYPTNQNGATPVTNANTHFVETAGFPGWTSQNWFYSINRLGDVDFNSITGGLTANGVNATDIVMTLPLQSLNFSNQICGWFGVTGSPLPWLAAAVNGSSSVASFKWESASSAFLTNADITGAPDVAGQFNIGLRYIADIS